MGVVPLTHCISETHIRHVRRICRVRRDDETCVVFGDVGEVDGLMVDVVACGLLTRLLLWSRVASVDDNRNGSRSKLIEDMIQMMANMLEYFAYRLSELSIQ